MNVKIDKTGLRFKISASELAVLAAAKPVREELQVAGTALAVEIDPKGTEDSLVPVYEEGLIRLTASPNKIRELLDLGRSRDGLEELCDGISVSLQVDFRTQKRQKPSKVTRSKKAQRSGAGF